MKSNSLFSCFAISAVVLLASACGPVAGKKDSGKVPQRASVLPNDFADVVKAMPDNRGKRCLGVCMTVIALTSGGRIESAEPASIDEMAGLIYHNFTHGIHGDYPASVNIDGSLQSVTSREALAAISTRIHEMYKIDYEYLAAHPQGGEILRQAEKDVVGTGAELMEILDGRTNHVGLFMAIGGRQFKDGELRSCSHVIILGLNVDQHIMVYDLNDPGRPIPAEIIDNPDGLIIGWTCSYPDETGPVIQGCNVIQPEKYFREWNGFLDRRRTK